MNSERLLIDKWRSLSTVQQQEVLNFVDFIRQKSLSENQNEPTVRSTFRGDHEITHHQSQQRKQQVKEWIKWASDNPNDSPGLPDEALTRDSIYSED